MVVVVVVVVVMVVVNMLQRQKRGGESELRRQEHAAARACLQWGGCCDVDTEPTEDNVPCHENSWYVELMGVRKSCVVIVVEGTIVCERVNQS
jgi:hypothetical protein